MSHNDLTPSLFPQEEPVNPNTSSNNPSASNPANSSPSANSSPAASSPLATSSVLPLRPLTTSQYSTLGVSPAWCEKNPTFQHVCNNYGPANWGLFTTHPDRAFAWTCPRVAQLDALFAPGCAEAWVLAQLAAMYPVVGRNPADAMARQVSQFASVFASAVHDLKLTEFMRFMGLFYMGHYKNDYGNLDVTRIGRIYHTAFLPERQRYLDHWAEEQRQRTERLTAGHGRYTSLDEWRSMPPTQPIHLIVEFLTRQGSPLEQEIAAFFNLAHPLADRIVEVVTTKQGLAQVHEWDNARALRVHDSWH